MKFSYQKGNTAIYISIAIALILILIVPGVALGTAFAYINNHTGAMAASGSSGITGQCYMPDQYWTSDSSTELPNAQAVIDKLGDREVKPSKDDIDKILKDVREAGVNPAITLATWGKEQGYGNRDNAFGVKLTSGFESELRHHINTLTDAKDNTGNYANRPVNTPIQVWWRSKYTPSSEAGNENDVNNFFTFLRQLVPNQITCVEADVSVVGNGNKICIDAGHNSNESRGFIGGSEGANNLEIATKLNETLKKRGFQTFMTRTGPTYNGTASKRKQDINNAGCAVSISIHSNAGGGSGTQTYTCNQDFPKRWDLFPDPIDSPTGAKINYSIGNNGTELAKAIHPLVVKAFTNNDGGIHPDTSAAVMRFRTGANGPDKNNSNIKDGDGWASSIGMVCRTNMPSILVEVGFHDKANEATLLKDSNKQQQVATAITDGVEKFLGK